MKNNNTSNFAPSQHSNFSLEQGWELTAFPLLSSFVKIYSDTSSK